MLKCLNTKITRGFTLIDVLIGVFLILIVFLGIFGAYQLGLKVVSQSKNRIVATALANQIIEQTQNLPYDKVGINRVGASPFGELEETEIVSLNNIDYTVEIGVDYVADSADGLVGPGDSCIYDYKRVRVTVFWSGNYTGEVSLATDIVPKNEVQECEETGGILWVHVFDTQGIKIEGALVQAENIITGIIKQCTSSLNDECYIPLDASPGGDPDNYKITVTKTGYSAEQTFKSGDTYGSEVITNPEKLNATILEGQVTEMSFSIDKVSTFSVETKSSRGKTSFDDDFNNMGKISDYYNISVSGGEVSLAKSGSDYVASGYLISTDVSSLDLKGWDQLSWVDSSPAGTTIIYQILYFDGLNWILAPDTDLPGNSIGLGSSPVDLSILDIMTYDQLQIKGTLSTTDLSQTPSLYEWHLSYFTRVAQPITASFYLQGGKVVGTNTAEDPIYKYLPAPHTISQSGNISGLEEDTYSFYDFVVSGESIELEEGVPGEILADGSLSAALTPDTTQSLILYLAATNTLLVKVEDDDVADPVFGASVRLYNAGLGYDKTQQTNEQGETFFLPLDGATYDLEIIAAGYTTYNGQVLVSGDTATTINLTLSPS